MGIYVGLFFFGCLFGSDPSQPFRLSPCVLSCSLFTALTYTDIPAHAHAHITVCMTGEGVLWHPTSSGDPWPFFGGSTVHAHISSTQHPDTPVSIPLLPGQDLTRLTIEIQHVTQGFRLMSWNHTLLVPVLNRLKEACVLNKMVQASIPPLLASFFWGGFCLRGSYWTGMEPTPNSGCYSRSFCWPSTQPRSCGHFFCFPQWIMGRQSLAVEFHFFSTRH